MIRSEYSLKLSRQKDPYAAWINEYEEKQEDKEIRGNVDSLIDELGYRVFKWGKGETDPLLYEYVSTLIREREPHFIYTDEDTYTEDRIRRRPYFKPDFSPDTLDGFFYLGGLLIISKKRITAYEQENKTTFPKELNAKTAELFADYARYEFDKLYELGHMAVNEKLAHISKVLFHSFEENNYYYDNKNQTQNEIDNSKVSVVILSKDNPGILKSCIRSLLKSVGKEKADEELEIIVTDNGSNDTNKQIIETFLSSVNATYIYHPMVFEYSTLCNIGAASATGEYILLLNDDVLFPKDNDCISHMKRYAKKPYIGGVGIKLLFPGDENYPENGDLSNVGSEHAIQHAGISLMNVGPSHKLASYVDNKDYYFGRNTLPYNMLAVTGACLMVKTSKFREVGGFDEILKIAYTDVDLCLDLFKKGYYTVCCNDIFAYHFESLSRGNDVAQKGKAKRLMKEREIFYDKHQQLLEEGDIFIGPNVTKIRLDYSIDYTQDWERITFASAEERVDIKELGSKKIREVKDKDVFGNIDRIEYIASSAKDVPSYYEIEGWMILHGKDQLDYRMYLGISNERNFSYYPVCEKYRGELSEVFPKEKNVELSGFILRIKEEEFERYEEQKLSFAFKSEKQGLFNDFIKYKKADKEICLGSEN